VGVVTILSYNEQPLTLTENETMKNLELMEKWQEQQ